MISYAPLWQTLDQKQITTYTLITKYNIDKKIIYKLKHNQNVTIETLEKICIALGCKIEEVVNIEE